MKVKTEGLLDTKLRKQLADCLRYYKKTTGNWIPREDVEVREDIINTFISGVSLEQLTEYIDPEDYKRVFVRGISSADYDGYADTQIETYSLRKQTDKEYFDSICICILPTEYQSSQYQVYLNLKKMFEME